MNTLIQDIRYAVRTLAKRPGFTVAALLALTLGIGANTAIFSVIDAVLLRPLSYDSPDRIVRIWGTNPQSDWRPLERPLSQPDFFDLRTQSQSFEHFTAYDAWALTLTGLGDPERIDAARISSGFFQALGTRPLLGREFLPEEEQPGRGKVVIVDHRFRQRYFAGDDGVIGRTLTLSGEPYTVVGVMPSSFENPSLSGSGSNDPEVWIPFVVNPDWSRSGHSLDGAVGRLKPGVSLAQAQAEMNTIASRLEQQYPDSNTNQGVRLIPLYDQVVGNMRPALMILFAAVGFVLLIACANVANLLLARATARHKEMAIRCALGAGRGRIVRQMLTESMLLSAVGGAIGLVLAVWATDALIVLSDGAIPRMDKIGLNMQVLGFTLCVALGAGILFGMIPALQAAAPNLNEGLKESSRGSSGDGGRRRLRQLLVVVEVALSLVLLIGAGLLIRSIVSLYDVDPGFRSEGLLTANVYLPGAAYPEDQQQITFFEQVLENLESQPGVVSAAVTSLLPLGGSFDRASVLVEGRPEPLPGQSINPARFVVSADYFKTMGIALSQGRLFNDFDRADNESVAIISETMVQRLWPGEDPLGKRFRLTAPNAVWRTVVGVVPDVKLAGLDDPSEMQMYFFHQQYAWQFMTLVIRTNADPAAAAGIMRTQVLAVDSAQPVFNMRTMEELLADSVGQRQFSMALLGIFAAVALVLASVGIYGVMSYAVNQRIHEFGIRMAIGARPSDIFRLVLGQGISTVLTGITLGLIAAFAVTRVLSNLLYGVTATDPVTFAGIALFLMTVALFACYIPARKATKVDPMVALRYE